MLKIKDNVDLKELTNFDFMYDDTIGKFQYIERNIGECTYIYINTWNRRILYRQGKDTDALCLIKLYDLIQAGLVEKVGE